MRVTVLSNSVDYIEKYPQRAKRILGISYQKWKELTDYAIAYNKRQEEKLELSKIRMNGKEGGRKPILTLGEEISLCLFY